MSIEVELSNIYEKLNYYKDYITKLGPSRRVGKNFESKVSESKCLYRDFKNILSNLSENISNELLILCCSIEECYTKILSFESRFNLVPESSLSIKMSTEKFDLKTAVSLLPKMNNVEDVTRELIDSIELYDSMLDDNGKQLLIKFVLKNRLTCGAKMRLASSYNSVELLLRDMRTYLLTRKSDTALQSSLQKARQGEKSVKEFGEEIEKLFVDLTISQANGDENAYKVLSPLNEKNAIKCFSDGLRSQRLSTIIAARNLTSLKDAIRVAEDETASTSDHQFMSYRQPPRFNNRNRFYYRGRGFRRQNYYNYFPSKREMSQSQSHQFTPSSNFAGRGGRGARARGASSYDTPARYARSNRVHFAMHSNNNEHLNNFSTNDEYQGSNPEQVNENEPEIPDEFFRS